MQGQYERVDRQVNQVDGPEVPLDVGETLDRQFVEQPGGESEGVRAEDLLVHEGQGGALLGGRHRVVRQASVRVADVVPVVPDAADVLGHVQRGRGDLPERLGEDQAQLLVAHPRFVEPVLHLRQELARDVGARPVVREDVGSQVPHVRRRVDPSRGPREGVLVGAVGQVPVAGARGDRPQRGLFGPG